MRQQKKKPLARKPATGAETDLNTVRKRRNSREPQVVAPQKVDLPLTPADRDEVVVPAAHNGGSLANGRD